MDGVFYLPYHQYFFDKIDSTDILGGNKQDMGSGLACSPIRLSKNKKALLISLTDTKYKNWYSWFHAEND